MTNVFERYYFCFHAKTVNTVNLRLRFPLDSVNRELIKETKMILKTLENDARVHIAS